MALGDVYKKVGGSWVLQTNIRGASGVAGALNDLSDVSGTPSTGDVLRKTAGDWQPATLDYSDVGAASSGHAHAGYASDSHDHDADYEAAGDIATHAADDDAHHAKYTDAEAVAAVEATSSLDLVGHITMDANKNITFASNANAIGTSTYGVQNLYVDNIRGTTGANIDVMAESVRLDGATDVRFYGGSTNSLIIWDGDQFYVTNASTGSKRLGHSSNYWEDLYVHNIYTDKEVGRCPLGNDISLSNTNATDLDWDGTTEGDNIVVFDFHEKLLIGDHLGWWRITCNVSISTDPDGYRRLLFYKNGTLVTETRAAAVVGNNTIFQFTALVEATNSYDYVSFKAWQNGGSSETIVANDTWVDWEWLKPSS